MPDGRAHPFWRSGADTVKNSGGVTSQRERKQAREREKERERERTKKIKKQDRHTDRNNEMHISYQ